MPFHSRIRTVPALNRAVAGCSLRAVHPARVLQARTVLDSITTVVDAKHILLQLADSREAQEHIAFADQLVLNKTELVSAAALAEIETRLRKLNPLAPIHRAQRSNVALDKVLGRGGFDIELITSLEPDFLNPAHGETGHVHNERCDHEHDSEILSISLTSYLPMDCDKISRWLTDLVARRGQDILRAKGIINVGGEDRRLVFQAIHMLLEGDLQCAWRRDEPRSSRLVFIGRNLDRAALQAAFDACTAVA
jgi:G3E family GTPase